MTLSPDEPSSPAPDPLPQPDDNARTWAMVAHLSALVGLLGNGIGFLLGPVVVWAIKKDQHPFVDEQGKEAINFQLTLLLAAVASFVVMFTIVGLLVAIPALIAIAIVAVVFPIVAAVSANRGEHYRYPLTWRLIK